MSNFPPVLPDSFPKTHNPILKRICRRCYFALGWRIEGDLADFSELSTAVIAIAPHTSNWDFMIGLLLKYTLEIKVTVMAKDSLFFWPLAPLLRYVGCFPVNRSAAGNYAEDAAERLRSSDKMMLVIAPEGTRSKVEQWKSGFARIAHAADVPILPIGFDFGQKKIEFHPLVKTSGDLEADIASVQNVLSQHQGRHPEYS